MIPTSLWITWLVVSAGGFILLETLGIADGRPGGTLSEVLWKWLGIGRPGFKTTRHGRVAIFSIVSGALCGVFAWLIPHILNGWGVMPLLLAVLVGATVGALGAALHRRR